VFGRPSQTSFVSPARRGILDRIPAQAELGQLGQLLEWRNVRDSAVPQTEPAQLGQPCKRSDVGDEVEVEIELSQARQPDQGGDVGHTIAPKDERFQPVEFRERRQVRDVVLAQVETDQVLATLQTIQGHDFPPHGIEFGQPEKIGGADARHLDPECLADRRLQSRIGELDRRSTGARRQQYGHNRDNDERPHPFSPRGV